MARQSDRLGVKGKSWFTLFVLLAWCVVAAPGAHATSAFISGVGVNKVRGYTNGTYGNCLAGISKNVNTEGNRALNCTETNLVTMHCDGGGPYPKGEGRDLFELMKMAWALGKKVDLTVDDTTGEGGACTVTAVFPSKANYD